MRRLLTDLGNRFAQHVDAVPAAEGSGEADHTIAGLEPEAASDLLALLGTRGSICFQVDAVRVDQNLRRVDAARHQAGADSCRYDADQRRLLEGERLGLEELRFVHVASAFEAAPRRDLGTVVFQDVRHAEFGAQQRSRRVTETKSLVYVRRP